MVAHESRRGEEEAGRGAYDPGAPPSRAAKDRIRYSASSAAGWRSTFGSARDIRQHGWGNRFSRGVGLGAAAICEPNASATALTGPRVSGAPTRFSPADVWALLRLWWRSFDSRVCPRCPRQFCGRLPRFTTCPWLYHAGFQQSSHGGWVWPFQSEHQCPPELGRSDGRTGASRRCVGTAAGIATVAIHLLPHVAAPYESSQPARLEPAGNTIRCVQIQKPILKRVQWAVRGANVGFTKQ